MPTPKKRRFGRVRKLPSGRYQARYPGPDGKDHTAPSTFASRRDADRFLAIVEGDLAKGRWIAPEAGRTTVREWSAEWFESVRSGLKPNTQHTYRSLLDRTILPRFGDAQLSAVLPVAVGRWVGELSARLSPSQVRQSYRLLSQIMNAAVDNDMLTASPCRGVKLPRLPEPDPAILTADQVDKLVAELDEPDAVLVLLLACAGLRMGEVLGLQRHNIDLDGSRVTIAMAVARGPAGPIIDTPKNHQRRELAIPGFVVARLRAYLESLGTGPDGFIFPGRHKRTADKPQSYNGVKVRFDRAVKRAGLTDVIPHDLRATHGTWVADSHGVMVAARRLGHSNASVTTRHYARAVDGRDAEVAAFLDERRRPARPDSPTGNG
jgi:integrase